ncbi:ADP-ribosylglycohydrolase family protein [Nostoc sp. FACHB-87]|uniref:ADP-ribosylglycohydrolase family protein n=1 Tax=Nostocales TaxID=1161 RepID=UPI0016866315|nr:MULTISPECIES: ADP-ribosylglycohydrolase family protein [Nostocales]MBD2301793.1 ADP-ribosylglycohydrolase family protein [Nostoc sp. FACHB-190]MBD2456669.1 ADP-ribosylglycohydrolase family protein [Nostoc sp. FACHB-87]MBD2478077.1 ADP-ribosylglycohydrolase family protein [Anabaena sp. FACHB-83]MBD2492642.1 ADP-ribosylglycohydrolase family protein [Aulosira sp. FACHB-615]
MLGAIAGDIIGSVYEVNNIKTKDFPLFDRQCRFTDDTVLTVAVAEMILDGADSLDSSQYIEQFKSYFRRYPYAGYGSTFRSWANSNDSQPYNSWGNGSAMRVSPIGFALHDLDTVLEAAKSCAAVTHNHPEGIKGAQATAAAIFLARTGADKPAIKAYLQTTFDYDLEITLDEIRPNYKFDVSCQGSVPQAIIAFLESTDYEDAIRNAISLGGDSDTIACIAGGIAQAYYHGLPPAIADQALSHLNDHLYTITQRFMLQYCN